MKQQQLFKEAPGKAEAAAPVPAEQVFQLAPEIGSPDELRALIEENYAGEEMSIVFDRVRIPPGGATKFEIPTGDPDSPEEAAEIMGVIVDHYRVNAYWPGEFSGEGTPPQCYSADGVTGTGDPGGPCERCEHNRWGTGKKERGRACKNMRRLYVLRPGETLPVVLTLPPTSLGAFRDFLRNLTFRHRMSLAEAVVRIGLKKAKNADGIAYSEVTLAPVGRLPKEQAQKIKAYAEALKPFTRRPPRTPDEITLDYAPAGGEAGAAFGEEPDF